MAAAIYTPSGSSQLTAVATTDKVRISTTTSAIAVAVGNSSVTANLTACEIIPANTVNNILSSDIRELVNVNKLKILSSTEKNTKFTFYGIEHITGVHDLPVNPTPCEINMVIEKLFFLGVNL